MNSVRAGMVGDPADYRWPSYQINALGKESELATPHPVYLSIGRSKADRLKNYRELFDSQIEGGLLLDIRYALNSGLILGTEHFKSQVEVLTGRRVSPFNVAPQRARATVFLL